MVYLWDMREFDNYDDRETESRILIKLLEQDTKNASKFYHLREHFPVLGQIAYYFARNTLYAAGQSSASIEQVKKIMKIGFLQGGLEALITSCNPEEMNRLQKYNDSLRDFLRELNS